MSYFETRTFAGDEWPYFNNHPTPCTQKPEYIFSASKMSLSEFVDKANRLFDEYNIKVPKNYPKLNLVKSEYYGKTYEPNPMDDFACCIISCILIKEKFDINVSKIIKDELIKNNSRSGILHANTMATVALYYLKNKSQVVIPKDQKNQRNPDLVIDGLNCEIKVVDVSDWTMDINHSTGKGKVRLFSEDICYDIGKFISSKNSGHKGIKQSDVIFADLSMKSFGKIKNLTGIKRNKFPKLHKYRIIYFAKKINEFSSFFLDFDPHLWEMIKTAEKKYRFGVLPASKGVT